MEKVRKEIHLSQGIVKILEKIAAASGKTAKAYMEDLVIEKTKTRLAQIKRHANAKPSRSFK